MKLPIYQLFGSENSIDVDVVFFIEKMPETIATRLLLSKKYSELIAPIFPEKVINANLAVCENGRLACVYKGTTDELNNSLFMTYANHKQEHQNQIDRLLKRDVDLKFLRSTRMVLSFLSKTEYREAVKKALKGDLNDKIEVLNSIDFTSISYFGKGKNSEGILKSLAFQFGQSILLHEGNEVYTKNQIGTRFPELKKYLDRAENPDFKSLQNLLGEFLAILKTRLPAMKIMTEYKYEDENDLDSAK